MDHPTYNVERILRLVRASFSEQQPGDLSCKEFFRRLWKKLEDANDPGVIKPSPIEARRGPYLYDQAPYELQAAAQEGFSYLLNARYVYPKPTGDYTNFARNTEYFSWTERGLQWIQGADPIPEDATAYMSFLKKLVPSLDEVVEQYVREALIAFNRDAYFAAAVMTGAASEKAIYLLATSLLSALKPSVRRTSLDMAMKKRQLSSLLDLVRKTLEDFSTGKQAPIPYSASEGAAAHLTSLFDAIRTQRNDAVHPLKATVSASSARLMLHSLPFALATTEKLREWLDNNPASL